MTQTYFAKVMRDNGLLITVEYKVEEEGSEHFDSPGHICDGGGSGPVISIVSAHDTIGEIELTEAEDERLCEKIAAEHVTEPDDPADYF